MSVRPPATAVLAVGFGASVAMWFLGYVGRLPAWRLPSPLLLAAMLACLPAAGAYLARRAQATGLAAASAGAVSGLVNLLVLGGLLGAAESGRLAPSPWITVPGSVALSALLAGIGTRLAPARAAVRGRPDPRSWVHALAWVAVAATLLLVGAGGIVTSAEAGLAVSDWPTSFGYNMFLYPLSRMTGGIYFEHAHRLLGALVGLTTVVLAACVQLRDPRRGVRRLAWLLVAAVIVQGVLGGLRVTERDLTLALIHGVLAQLFLAGLLVLAAVTAQSWRDGPTVVRRDGSGSQLVLGGILLGLLVVQLGLGAAQRHYQALLLFHVTFGLAVVVPCAVHLGMRSWGLHVDLPRLQRLGLGLVAAIALQVVLGIATWFATGRAAPGRPGGLDVTLATAHQWMGAVVLGLAVLLETWSARLLGFVTR